MLWSGQIGLSLSGVHTFRSLSVRPMQQADLRKILDAHAEWLSEGAVSFSDPRRANLQSADLQSADLRYADLQYANLRYADLQSADLRYADLQYANLRYADLQSADLQSANLQSADLRSANLQSADLQSADLRYADLQSADLRYADLQYANLQSADLRSANLQSADLRSAGGFAASDHLNVFWIIPEVGTFRCFKKLRADWIAELEVPHEARRVCNLKNPRKFRLEYVKVVAITRGTESTTEGTSLRGNLKYVVGEIARPDSFDDSMLEDCSNGIHAFITKQEALAWT